MASPILGLDCDWGSNMTSASRFTEQYGNPSTTRTGMTRKAGTNAPIGREAAGPSSKGGNGQCCQGLRFSAPFKLANISEVTEQLQLWGLRMFLPVLGDVFDCPFGMFQNHDENISIVWLSILRSVFGTAKYSWWKSHRGEPFESSTWLSQGDLRFARNVVWPTIAKLLESLWRIWRNWRDISFSHMVYL